MKKILKGAGAILILAVLVLSSAAVYGQNTNTTNKNAISLTEISQPSSTIITTEPQQSRGPVLWDNGDPDGRNGVSCVYRPSDGLERYIIDDFYVPEGGWEIGDGHFRIVTGTGAGPEILDDVLVFFFYNTGPCEPTMEPYATADPSFTAYETGDYYFDRPEIKVDCIFDPPITLPMDGEWWVCFQPVLEDNCFWLTTVEHDCTILLDYVGQYSRWTYGFDIFNDYYDVSFVLTGVGGDPSIDVEKYVWSEKLQEWVDADTEDEAIDVKICHDVTFKIVIHNDGEVPLQGIKIDDKMHGSLKFISGDPEPDEVYFEDPFWYMNWFFPGPLNPCETIEIYITAHVEGPECSYDFNYVLVEAGGVRDEDYAWVHAHDRAKEFNSPILNFLESHPNIFPLLQLLLQRLGLF
jgi:hypothetical protein